MGNLRREINWQRSNCDLKRKNIRVSLLTSAFIVTMDRGHVDTRHGASLFKARYTSGGGPWAASLCYIFLCSTSTVFA